MNFYPEEFLDLEKCDLPEIFAGMNRVWEPIKKIADFLAGKKSSFAVHGEIKAGAHVLGPVHLGPCWIGRDVKVRAGAYIRENVIIGSHSVVGNSCELKNCLLFQGCEVPHFNYVGDSVLGHRAHLGAGAILSNVRLDRREVCVQFGGEKISTGLKKFGAVIGDFTEVGCNCVINPGSIIGRRCVIHPLVSWKGVLEEGHVVRNTNGMSIFQSV